MREVSVVSTKGGVGKTTVAANLGGLLADAGLRVLLLDLDSQPTLSSYYALSHVAIAGAYELIALNQTDPAQIISTTTVVGLDLILSNDDQGRLSTLLLHVPDGRLRLRNLLDSFRPNYDLLLIETQGARSVLLEMAILASDLALSPITPEMLAARELRRGTLKLLSELEPSRHLGIPPAHHRSAIPTGRPSYDPVDLLKLNLYGYFQRIRSSRRLEAECQRNIEVMWLLGRLASDFKTIADFRRDNSAAFTATCRAFVRFCRNAGLIAGELVAIAGSKFQALASSRKHMTPKKLKHQEAVLDQRIARYLAQLNEADRNEGGESINRSAVQMTLGSCR